MKRNSADDGGKIRINISNQSGDGERVSIRYGKQDSDAQPVTFDLPHNSNEGIVLNLSSPNRSYRYDGRIVIEYVRKHVNQRLLDGRSQRFSLTVKPVYLAENHALSPSAKCTGPLWPG